MTAPNPRYENLDIMVTRRVHGREFRLRPCKKTNAIVDFGAEVEFSSMTNESPS